MPRRSTDAAHLAAALGGISLVSLLYVRALHVSNAAIASTTFLLIVLVVAATSRLRVAVITSLAALVCLNFFFLPPVGAFTIADPQNWAALIAFLAVSLIASNLSASARTQREEAVGRRDELARLFDLSRDVLAMTASREALTILARSVARRFDIGFVAIALPRDDEWELFEAGARGTAIDPSLLSQAFAAAQTSLEFDAYARTYAGHRTLQAGDTAIRLVPLRVGTKPIGLLAAAGRPIEPGTLDALAGVVAIAIERAELLDARKAGELTRQSEELKTALLASLGHDLRTPLTAIRVAATNLQGPAISAADRLDQSNLILAEAGRLTRLFQNILQMARIDAGAVAAQAQWTHPSEIIAAARDQVEHTLDRHTIVVRVDPDVPVCLDPRLTASAIAHLLENAAQYSPAGSAIEVDAGSTREALTLHVRDHGAGVAVSDLPRLFDRFYRGDAAKVRASGTGMGLWIARGLLAAEQGRVWAENSSSGGARFSIVVPTMAVAPVAPTASAV